MGSRLRPLNSCRISGKMIWLLTKRRSKQFPLAPRFHGTTAVPLAMARLLVFTRWAPTRMTQCTACARLTTTLANQPSCTIQARHSVAHELAPCAHGQRLLLSGLLAAFCSSHVLSTKVPLRWKLDRHLEDSHCQVRSSKPQAHRHSPITKPTQSGRSAVTQQICGERFPLFRRDRSPVTRAKQVLG